MTATPVVSTCSIMIHCITTVYTKYAIVSLTYMYMQICIRQNSELEMLITVYYDSTAIVCIHVQCI